MNIRDHLDHSIPKIISDIFKESWRSVKNCSHSKSHEKTPITVGKKNLQTKKKIDIANNSRN